MQRELAATVPAASAAAAAPSATPPNYAGMKVTLAVALAAPALAFAAPTGGQVKDGVATIAHNGAVTTVTQNSLKAVIDWQGFSVGAGETVNFDQPFGSKSVILNRVTGNERSVIDGAVNAPGQVFIVNSAGILFGKNSTVNVGGLVASTRDIANIEFMAGHYVLAGSGNGAVVNRGSLTAAEGGYVALVGNHVTNEGVITARLGTAALAAGDKVTLNLGGNALLGITVDAGTLNTLVENREAIVADGGTVLLTAKAADALQGALVNNDGLVQAHTIGDLIGHIELRADGGTAQSGGTLDASAPAGGNGGFVETFGDRVRVELKNVFTQAAAGRNGKLLVVPVDFTIAPSGGDMTGEDIGSYLDRRGDFEVAVKTPDGKTQSPVNIHVNDEIKWGATGSTSTLTLGAAHDIYINAPITIESATGKLVMNFGGDYDIRTVASYSGTVLDAAGKPVKKPNTSGGKYGSINFTHAGNKNGLEINGTRYTLIHSMDEWDDLDARSDRSDPNGWSRSPVKGNYAIADNLTAKILYTEAPVRVFTGTLAGLGHKIDGFTMTGSETGGNLGLIGKIADGTNATIRDLGMENIKFTGTAGGQIGAILGEGKATLSRVYATGEINLRRGFAGGVVGMLEGDVISSYSTVNLTVSDGYGGGGGLASYVNGDVLNSHATGSLAVTVVPGTGGAAGGGLVNKVDGNVRNAYASGDVKVEGEGKEDRFSPAYSHYYSNMGGLIGAFGGGTLENSFATGDVTGGTNLGGLVGTVMGRPAVVRNAYAEGNVTAGWGHGASRDTAAGGLIGAIANSSEGGYAHVSDVYALGDVTALTGGNHVGGLFGVFGYSTSSPLNTLTNAHAEGNVTSAVFPELNSMGFGGLIGTVIGADISNAHATGDVSGFSRSGGLLGNSIYSKVSDSYATGAARAYHETWGAGGLIGATNNTVTSNVYYNADVNERGYSNLLAGAAPEGIQGLTGSALADAAFYANHTIGQVQATRDAAAAAEAERAAEAARAAEEAANAERAAAAAEAERATQAAQALAAAEAARATAAAQAASAAEATRAAATAQAAQEAARAARATSALRQAATQAGAGALRETARTSAPAPVQPAASPARNLDRNIAIADASRFSANVRRIEVDGQVFELDEEGDDRPTTR